MPKWKGFPVRPDCSIAASVRSAYDGFFDFREVTPGLYTLRASAGGLSDAALKVEIEPSGSLLEGKDLVLRRP